ISTNGTTMTAARARRLAQMSLVDVQVSVDGALAGTNDALRGDGSWAAACRALEELADAGLQGCKLSVVLTRHNAGELDALEALATRHGGQLRLTRLRPSGRGAAVWADLRPTAEQQRHVHRWLVERPWVLTGDSFFHLSALGESLPGLGMCGAGRVVCLVDPLGDVYPCPFVLHPDFRAGSVLAPGGLAQVWRHSPLLSDARQEQAAAPCATCGAYASCQGGCMAAKLFTGLALDGPDPECALGRAEPALATAAGGPLPLPGPSHSRTGPSPRPVPVGLRRE
ncbi:MAG: mycofactocin radical SAM maturase, partial [Acidimicrobiales bacterium]